MHKKVDTENIIKIPDKIVAYVSGCSVETVKKVKGNKRKDKFNINGNTKLIADFLKTIKEINN